jgi:argininosuccinate lyase
MRANEYTLRALNDQVLVDVNLYLKDAYIHPASQITFDLLMESAEKYQNVLLPGYIYTNRYANLYSEWFFAYAETLIDDTSRC